MFRTTFNSYGKFFLQQDREHFLKGCVILCIAKFECEISKGIRKFSFLEYGRNRIHAEEFVFLRIREEEGRRKSKAIQVEIFSSFSPCDKCCELVTNFAKTHPGCSVSVVFSCVYRHGEEAHCAALRRLHQDGVLSRLDVFRAAEWRLLESRGLLSLSPYAWWNMRQWDFFWRDRLMAILSPVSPEGSAVPDEESNI
jgi:hypothetical protein